jgi:hypothetical protein
MAAIFLSYSRDSAALADLLAADLKELGHSVWLDRELSGGQAWWTQILAAVQVCDLFVLVVTAQALGSTACKREHEYAAALGKPILPVLDSDTISPNLLPPALAQIQFVDYRSRDRAAVLRLARAVAALPAAGPQPDPLPPPPDVPVSYLTDLAERVNRLALSYEEQSALLLDLKRGVLDGDTAADVRTLLKALRKRRDLYAAIAEEIDDLNRSGASARPRRTSAARQAHAPSDTPEPEPVTRRVAASEGSRAPAAGPPGASAAGQTPLPGPAGRRLSALAGFAVGSLLGVMAVMEDEPNLWFIGFALGIAGAIAGAICRLRPVALVSAAIGAALGWALVTRSFAGPDAFAQGAVAGAGPGAILGAVVGSSYLKSRAAKA